MFGNLFCTINYTILYPCFPDSELPEDDQSSMCGNGRIGFLDSASRVGPGENRFAGVGVLKTSEPLPKRTVKICQVIQQGYRLCKLLPQCQQLNISKSCGNLAIAFDGFCRFVLSQFLTCTNALY